MNNTSDLINNLSLAELKLFSLELNKARDAEPEIPRVSRDGQQFPLSYGQQRLWFLSLLDPDLPAYNMLSAVRLSGHLSFRALLSS
ncbi:MAG: condensation protein, partial [Blastocatellia bacterium]